MPEKTVALLAQLHDWRKGLKAKMPTDNPLKAKLAAPLRDGGFRREGFHLWDPSIIKVGDTYHMFASCRPSENFNLWKSSYIVRAASKNLLGPYSFAGEVFRPQCPRVRPASNASQAMPQQSNRFHCQATLGPKPCRAKTLAPGACVFASKWKAKIFSGANEHVRECEAAYALCKVDLKAAFGTRK
jgi:hypothetical protein